MKTLKTPEPPRIPPSELVHVHAIRIFSSFNR